MVFRSSAMAAVVVVLTALLAAPFSAGQERSTPEEVTIPMCVITSDATVPTFQTMYITMDEYKAYDEAGALYGPCRDYLGQLCDDGKKCTIDYDYENGVCLPMPREVVSGCDETM